MVFPTKYSEMCLVRLLSNHLIFFRICRMYRKRYTECSKTLGNQIYYINHTWIHQSALINIR